MRRLLPLATALVLMLSGCPRKKGEGQDQSWASQAVDSTDVAQNEAALFIVGLDGADVQASSGDELAASAQAKATTFWQPAGCVTAAATGPKVTYTLDDCSGPFGLLHVTGTVDVTYSLKSDGIHADAKATGLVVNGATLDISSSAVYSVEQGRQKLVVSTQGNGVGPRGVSFSRDGDYTLTWDNADGCLGLDGTWNVTALGRTWTLDVGAFDKCAGRCPAAGGSISYTGGLSGVTITVEFDGSDVATWSSSRGNSGTVNLFCL